MTWDQFKDYVDRHLAEMGAGGGVLVWYVEVTFPSTGHPKDEPSVYLDPQLGVAIS